MHIRIASIMLVASILGIGAIAPVASAQAQQQDLIQAIAGGFESISVTQDANQIVITITKEGEPGEPAAPGEENVTIPEGPIVIVPPDNETGQNGTVILVPEPPASNVTEPAAPGNVTAEPAPTEPPIIIVEPPSNVTQVEPPSNVTVIDNGTVIIAPPDQPITETPGNVTIIDPPPVNATEPGIPAECGCPIGVEGGAPDIQAPGANITMENETTTIIRPDTQPGEESGGNGDGDGDGNGNGNGDGGG